VTASPVVDTDELPPTQYLILEVLAARWRLGERLWTFPTSCRPAAAKLAELGLTNWRSGPAAHTIQVWLTEAGRAASLSETYVPPIVKELQ
jgi:hypothetical protein